MLQKFLQCKTTTFKNQIKMKLIITKFKRHENLEVSVPSEIRGGNGTGKSTIIEAFSFCLTGKDMQGNEFKQIYDNRVDLHEAIADVTFVDNYGNEFRRVVAPIYSVNRAGIEELKIKRSTQCSENGINVNDFSDKFSDFLKFGTDYFFNQKEDVQRSIFIDLLKSKMPDYDVKSASLKLKELKKSQKTDVADVKTKTEQLKGVKDVEVSVIEPEILALNAEYIKLSEVDNSKQVAEINKRNNDLMMSHFTAKTNIQNDISRCNISIERTKSQIEQVKEQLKLVESAVFVPALLNNHIIDIEHTIDDLTAQLNRLEYFETIEAYAAKFFNNNPILVENGKKIKELSEKEFIPSSEISSACPLSGEVCETAKLHSVASEKHRFDISNKGIVNDLKAENRSILTKEMTEVNQKYLSAKSDLQEAKRKLNNIIESNKKIEADNFILKSSFEIENKKQFQQLQIKEIELNQDLRDLNTKLEVSKLDLLNLAEPIPEKLPENLEISDEIREAHATVELANIDINKQIGVNENNVKLRVQYNAEIKTLQGNLFIVGEEITKLTAEISDYFSNLQGVVKNEFSGDIEIDVELLEYVMSKDEWTDCFKITANGKVFPYECNGSLQNNLKLQVLSTFQRLKDYKGVTLMDNCEANTTDPIETCGLNCVLAYATNDKDLTIK